MISTKMIQAISAGMRAAILEAAKEKPIGFCRTHEDGEWTVQVDGNGVVQNGGYALHWHGPYRKLAELQLWELGALLDGIAPKATEQLESELTPAVSEETREQVCTAVAESLGDAYDCTRVWSAWGVGTMSQADFSLVAEDDSRVAEIADAAISALGARGMLSALELLDKAAGIALQHNYTGGGIDAAVKIRALLGGR
jgi:hypothetical protein